MMKKMLITVALTALLSSVTHAGTVGRFHFLTQSKAEGLSYYTKLVEQHCVSSATGLPASFSVIDNTLKLVAEGKNDATRPCFYQESYYTVAVYADEALSEKVAKVKFRNRSRYRWFPDVTYHKVDVAINKVASDDYKIVFGAKKG